MMTSKFRIALLSVLSLGTLILTSCSTTMSGVVIADIEIEAPVEEVFDYMADCRNIPEVVPAVKSVRNIRGQGLGMTFDWTIEGNGMRTEGTTVIVDYAPYQKIVQNTSCGKIVTMIFEPLSEDRTRLTLSVMYASEVPVEGATIKRYVDKSTHAMFEGMLENVKAQLEK